MSTFKYAYGAQLIGTAQLNLTTAVINALLVSGVYAPKPYTDQHVADIPPAAILVRTGYLTGQALNNGVFSGNIPTQNAFLSATICVGLVLFNDTGNDALSPLLYYSSDGPGFPFKPAGFNYSFGYDQSNGGFFQV